MHTHVSVHILVIINQAQVVYEVSEYKNATHKQVLVAWSVMRANDGEEVSLQASEKVSEAQNV